MPSTTPDWLARHGCSLASGVDHISCLVMLANQPQYRLMPIPLRNSFGCSITQTINGKRLDGGGTYPTVDEAIRGGLEDLRKALGW
jgi:hypothetical protein